jgi:hypothetical protein
MKATFLPASYFYQTGDDKISHSTFYYRVATRKVNFIQEFNGVRLYDVADWNKKNPDCMVSGEVTVKQVESTD